MAGNPELSPKLDKTLLMEKLIAEALNGSDLGRPINDWGSSVVNKKLVLVSVTDTPTAKVVYEYTVGRDALNRIDNLHGGCTATIFDICTSTAVVPLSKPGFWSHLGVSMSLNVTYLKPIPMGSVILIESEVLSIGKRIAVVKGVMKRKSDGAIMAVCEHGRVNIFADTPSKI